MRGERNGRFVRTAAFVSGLGALGIFALLPSATAAHQPMVPATATAASVAPDLSTLPKIKAYLRSQGMDPSRVVIQRGARNYAGPNCPGASWNCTTARKVVQLSPSVALNGGAVNRFVCKRDRGAGTVTQSPTPPNQSCVIVQPGGSRNSATCEIRTTGSTGTISQACFITQGGAQNDAFARLVAVMGSSAGEQDVVQRIEIKQTGGASGNTLEASEIALLGAADKGGGNVDTKQDFHQVICGNQLATGSGSNTAKVNQHGGAATYYTDAGAVDIEQNRDFMDSTCTENPPGAGPFDDISLSGHDPLSCAVEGGTGSPKEAANTCARIQQESTSGRNKIDRQTQTNLLFSSVNGADSVDIDQGTFSGGIDSTQDQTSSGVSTIFDTQDSDQVATVHNVDAGLITIQQVEDPRCCAAGHQLGNAGNTWTLKQDLKQRAFVDGSLVDPDLFVGIIVQRGADYGNCETSGVCTVEQSVSNNVETETNSCSGSSCDIFVDCAAGSFEDVSVAGAAVIQEVGNCTTDEDDID